MPKATRFHVCQWLCDFAAPEAFLVAVQWLRFLNWNHRLISPDLCLFPQCDTLDRFPFVYFVSNLFPTSKKDSKCWVEAGVLQLRWHFLVGHFTVVHRDLIVLCRQMWHNHFLVGGKSVAGLLSVGFLLQNPTQGLRDLLWLHRDCSWTDVGVFGYKSYQPSDPGCAHFLKHLLCAGEKILVHFQDIDFQIQSTECHTFPMSGTKIDPMESFWVLWSNTAKQNGKQWLSLSLTW